MTFTDFHNAMMEAKDVDPAIVGLKYVCDRFELNPEQQYWLAFLYGCSYSAVTTFHMYNEFPDPDRVNLNRMERWWKANRQHTIFQTDRARVRSNNQFVPAVASYLKLTRGSQARYFNVSHPAEMYERITAIYTFGRFTAFNMLDAINALTPTRVILPFLNLREARSCRNGVAWAIGREDLVTKGRLTPRHLLTLHEACKRIVRTHRGNIFNIETTLCAYAKYKKGQRFVGYYIERMRKELLAYQAAAPDGVCWDVLWQFRAETFDNQYLQPDEYSANWGMRVRQNMDHEAVNCP
jgi:hypothetical protein